MLILTRKTNERIFIGDDIVLVVLGMENNRVKLGLEAPSDVTILREEIVANAKQDQSDNESNQTGAGGDGLKTGT